MTLDFRNLAALEALTARLKARLLEAQEGHETGPIVLSLDLHRGHLITCREQKTELHHLVENP